MSQPDDAAGADGVRGQELLRAAVGGLGGSVLWTFGSVVVTTVCTLFLVGYGLRVLGPAEYGTYALLSAVSVLLLVLDFGLSLGVVRATALRLSDASGPEARVEAEEDVHTAHHLYLLLGGAVVGLASVGSLGYGIATEDWSTALTGLLVMSAAAVNLSFASYQGVATGHREFGLVTRAGISATLVLTAVVLVLLGSLGLPALGLGQLAAAFLTRFMLARWVSREVGWFRSRLALPDWHRARRVAGRAGPLVFVSGGSQLINTANLSLIAAVAAPSAVGLFRAASALPTQLVAVLYRAFDVVFPTLVGAGSPKLQDRLNALLTRCAAFVSGVLFGVLFFGRGPATGLLTGSNSTTASRVLGVFCLIWLVNVPVHGLYLLVIARNEQRRFVLLTAFEGVLNLTLTVVLTLQLGAFGAALAGLVTIFVSNAVVLPVLLARVLVTSVWRTVYVEGYLRAAVGFALVGAVSLVLPTIHDASGALVALLGASLVLAVPAGYLSVGAESRGLLAAAAQRRPLTLRSGKAS